MCANEKSIQILAGDRSCADTASLGTVDADCPLTQLKRAAINEH
jgi:hypothetical protein